MYSDKVMDHFKNPRNTGEIPDADGVGTVGNPTCGDLMTIYIKVKDDRIEDDHGGRDHGTIRCCGPAAGQRGQAGYPEP